MIRRIPIFIASTVFLLTIAATRPGSPIGDQFARHRFFFTKDSTGNGILQRTTDTGGFLTGYRYRINRGFQRRRVRL